MQITEAITIIEISTKFLLSFDIVLVTLVHVWLHIVKVAAPSSISLS